MSDLFISYAKTDHALALRLSAFLEAEGWTVWWDKSLGAADLYRDEIMKQLAAARAVITIWSPNSIKSDWVRAEAGTAKKEGKLIPVKTPEVGYADIPLPFGEMHTENVGSTALIRAAIVAQLAKPAVEPSAWASLRKGLKWELLSWAGIVGGALTLFTNLGAVLKLADWARWLVEHWKEWTHAAWVWLFGWLGIHVPPEWTPVLSFLLFWSLLTVGQAVQFHNTIKLQPVADKYRVRSFRLMSRRTLLVIILLPVVTMLWWWFVFLLLFGPDYRDLQQYMFVIRYFAGSAVAEVGAVLDHGHPADLAGVIFTAVLLWVPQVMLALFARDRLNAAVTFFIMPVFWIIIISNPILLNGSTFDAAAAFPVSMCLILLLPLILLSVAPAKAVSRRLIWLALGLLILIALNELSKLGLDLAAPQG
jgi:hypothetical protein